MWQGSDTPVALPHLKPAGQSASVRLKLGSYKFSVALARAAQAASRISRCFDSASADTSRRYLAVIVGSFWGRRVSRCCDSPRRGLGILLPLGCLDLRRVVESRTGSPVPHHADSAALTRVVKSSGALRIHANCCVCSSTAPCPCAKPRLCGEAPQACYCKARCPRC